jgi:uncharacterized membrane protein
MNPYQRRRRNKMDSYFFYIMGILIFLVYVVSFPYILSNKREKERYKEKTNQKDDEITQDQYEQMLMKLFIAGVIDQNQYNHYLVRGLPLFKA